MNKLCLFLIITFALLPFYGCGQKQEHIVVEVPNLSDPAQNVKITEELVYQLKSGMTYNEVAAIIGTDCTIITSAMNPETYQWIMADGRELTITFWGDPEFHEKYKNGVYRLPDEPLETNQDGSELATENEKRALITYYATRKATNIQIKNKDGTVIKIS